RHPRPSVPLPAPESAGPPRGPVRLRERGRAAAPLTALAFLVYTGAYAPRSSKMHSPSRRRFVLGTASAGALLALGLPRRAALAGTAARRDPEILSGRVFDLSIGYRDVDFTGTRRVATVVNDSLPAPVLHWREGDRVTLRVTNRLAVDSSIHWHGILLPAGM